MRRAPGAWRQESARALERLPSFEAAGGNDLVLLMVGIDVALGPLLTFTVFNPGKETHR